MFERPSADPETADRILREAAANALARRAAEKAIELLKSDAILPLDVNASKRLAVIGPQNRQEAARGYAGAPKATVTVLEGLRAAAGPDIETEQADGVCLTMPTLPGGWPETSPSRPVNATRIAEAMEVAGRSDVIVPVLGGHEQVTRKALSALPRDRNEPSLFGEQDTLVEAMAGWASPSSRCCLTAGHGPFPGFTGELGSRPFSSSAGTRLPAAATSVRKSEASSAHSRHSAISRTGPSRPDRSSSESALYGDCGA